jgi:hypothetical protein
MSDTSSFFFEVTSSSSGEIYNVKVSREGVNLTCTCTCPAGQMKTACKHRRGILQGNRDGVTGGDLEEIEQIPSLLVGTDVGEAMNEVLALEAEMDILKKRIFGAKKVFARALED